MPICRHVFSVNVKNSFPAYLAKTLIFTMKYNFYNCLIAGIILRGLICSSIQNAVVLQVLFIKAFKDLADNMFKIKLLEIDTRMIIGYLYQVKCTEYEICA